MTKEPLIAVMAVSPDTVDKMAIFYHSDLVPVTSPYMLFMSHLEECQVIVYKKIDAAGKQKAVFQGPKAYYEASIWGKPPLPDKGKPVDPITKKKIKIDLYAPSIGSDEVGTGDFFGPISVCGAYLDRDLYLKAKALGITDSKLMNDEYIRKIGPALIKEFPYSQLSLDNAKYNEVISKGLNMNSIKAKMHNRCLLNLRKRYPAAKLYQDQFAAAGLYYSYLKDEKEIARPIIFSTKGELAFPAVALASVIARYSFLRKMDALRAAFKMDIPLGAGENVDAFAADFLSHYGKEKLDSVVKKNFANYKRLFVGKLI